MSSSYGFIKHTIQVFTVDEEGCENRGEKEIIVVAPETKVDVSYHTFYHQTNEDSVEHRRSSWEISSHHQLGYNQVESIARTSRLCCRRDNTGEDYHREQYRSWSLSSSEALPNPSVHLQSTASSHRNMSWWARNHRRDCLGWPALVTDCHNSSARQSGRVSPESIDLGQLLSSCQCRHSRGAWTLCASLLRCHHPAMHGQTQAQIGEESKQCQQCCGVTLSCYCSLAQVTTSSKFANKL